MSCPLTCFSSKAVRTAYAPTNPATIARIPTVIVPGEMDMACPPNELFIQGVKEKSIPAQLPGYSLLITPYSLRMTVRATSSRPFRLNPKIANIFGAAAFIGSRTSHMTGSPVNGPLSNVI